jgi:hypothetical protein
MLLLHRLSQLSQAILHTLPQFTAEQFTSSPLSSVTEP